jgi:signal transduction histidine kinase
VISKNAALSKNGQDLHARIRSTAGIITVHRQPSRDVSAARRTTPGERKDLAARYALALHEYLAGRDQAALSRGGELGRKALAEGLGVLEVVTAHSRALVRLLPHFAVEERARVFDDGERFLVEALSPLTLARERFCGASVTLHRLLEGQVRRIAFALHDEAAQLLASVHFALATVAKRLPAEHAQEIRAARAMLDEVEARLRRLAHELRPPLLEDLGLVPALQFLADAVSKRKGLPVVVEASVQGDLPPIVETTLYRIVQEALTNITKHANATRAWVCVRLRPDKIACSVRDNGVGFDANALGAGKRPRGLGLLEIQERVAALGGIVRLCANTPHGTHLTIKIPLDRHSA